MSAATLASELMGEVQHLCHFHDLTDVFLEYLTECESVPSAQLPKFWEEALEEVWDMLESESEEE